MTTILSLAGFIVGIIIGYTFGIVQHNALERNKQKQKLGALKSGWAIMPGSGLRIAYLMVTLIIVQIICPLFFDGNIQWLVSGGIVFGYAWTLTQQLRKKLLLK